MSYDRLTPLALTLRGITGDDVDFGVDTLRELHLPQMAYFGVREGLALETRRRGCAPAGGGEVRFTCPVVRELKPCSVVEEGFVKQVRGVAFTCKVSPQVASTSNTSFPISRIEISKVPPPKS